MNKNTLRQFFAALLLTPFFGLGMFSCSYETEGIFYSLELEEKAADNSLPNEVRFTGNIIKIVSLQRYYIAAGSVFYRDYSDQTSEWVKIGSPIPNAIATGIVQAGSDIFVSLTNGSTHGLYRLDASEYDTYDTGANLYSTRQITGLFSLNDQLFAQTGSELDDTYELLRLRIDGTGLEPTGLDTYKIVAGAWDGTKYWFLGPADVFSHTDPTGWNGAVHKFDPGSTGLQDKTYFKDIFSDPDLPNTLYICTSDGYIIRSTDGGSAWTSSVKHSASFLSIGKVAGIIVFGVNRDGIKELADNNNIDSLSAPGGNFVRLPYLYRSTVLRLFGDGTQLLAGTSSAGLWRGDYSSDVVRPVWSQE